MSGHGGGHGGGSEAPVRAKLIVDVEEASEKVEHFFDSWGAKALGLEATYELVEHAIEKVGEAIEFVVETAVELLEAFEKQEEAEKRLIISARLRGQATEDLLEQTLAFDSALQHLTGISDQVTLNIQAQLLAMGVYAHDIPKATLAVVGFSEAHGVPLQTAVKTVGKIIEGNLEILKRYGDSANSVNEAIERYAEFSEIAIDKGKTLGGNIRELQADWKDLHETLGHTVAESESLKTIIEALSFAVRGAAKIFKDNEHDIGHFFEVITAAAAIAAGVISPLVHDIEVLSTIGAGALIAHGEEQVDTQGIPDKLRDQEKLQQAQRDEIETKNREAEKKAREAAAKEFKKGEEEVDKLLVEHFKKRKQLRDEITDLEVAEEKRRFAERAQAERDNNEVLFAIQLEAFEAEQDLKQALLDEDFDRQEDAFNKRIDSLTNFSKRYIDKSKLLAEGFSDVELELINVGAAAFGVLEDGVTQVLQGLFQALADGQDIGDFIGGIFGGLLNQMGDSLIAMGVSALALQALSLIPFFTAIAGPPGASAAAGAIALAAGLTVKGIAAAIGGGHGHSSASATVPGSHGAIADVSSGHDAPQAQIDQANRQNYIDQLTNRDTAGSPGSRGRGGSSSSAGNSAPIVTEYHVHLRGSIVAGNEDRAGRHLLRAIRRAQRLEGSGARATRFAG